MRHRHLKPAGFAALLLSFSLPVMAGDTTSHAPQGVVELFTSQGCSSCPPADAALRALIDQGGIIAVAYHVDYWNYRGWRDTLSDKKYTERQYGYARTLGRGNVYTPQAVLNGQTDTTASNAAGIASSLALMKQKGEGLTVAISAKLSKDELQIDVGAGQGKADIVIAYFKDKARVTIERGENAGETIDYRHSVTELATVGMWGGAPQTITLPAALVKTSGHDGCAIFLQVHDAEGNPGRILGAAILDDYS